MNSGAEEIRKIVYAAVKNVSLQWVTALSRKQYCAKSMPSLVTGSVTHSRNTIKCNAVKTKSVL